MTNGPHHGLCMPLVTTGPRPRPESNIEQRCRVSLMQSARSSHCMHLLKPSWPTRLYRSRYNLPERPAPPLACRHLQRSRQRRWQMLPQSHPMAMLSRSKAALKPSQSDLIRQSLLPMSHLHGEELLKGETCLSHLQGQPSRTTDDCCLPSQSAPTFFGLEPSMNSSSPDWLSSMTAV